MTIDEALNMGLDRDDFYDKRHGAAYQGAVDLHAGGDAVDHVSWPTRVPGLTSGQVTDWEAQVTSTANFATHAGTVMDNARRRDLLRLLRDGAGLARTGDPAEVVELVNRGLARVAGRGVDAPVTSDLFIDWSTLWNRDRTAADFLIEDVFVRGRGHSLYAAHKAGKSLFMFGNAVQMIREHADVVVLFLDYEMTEDDTAERGEDMGLGPGDDLDRLKYWQLPTIGPLNTRAGANDLLAVVDRLSAEYEGHHLVVVIDTFSRAVAGDENDSEPYRDFYRLTGLPLKQRGVTWVRLDHEGKDPGRGQRGSSAKGDDVDIAWKLAKGDGTLTLTRALSRVSWVPEKVTFAVQDNPLRFVRTAVAFPAGTRDCMAALDALEVAVDASANSAVKHLRDAGEGRRKEVVVAAQRERRRRIEEGTR